MLLLIGSLVSLVVVVIFVGRGSPRRINSKIDDPTLHTLPMLCGTVYLIFVGAFFSVCVCRLQR